LLKISNQILKNLISLTSAEVLSKIIGLITAAYLGRVLKPEGFGILGFATAFVSYFLLMVNFGLDTYGTREVAKERSIIPKLVNNILSVRLIFASFWFIILNVVIILIDKPVVFKLVLIITGINLFVNALSINWIFLGIEKMWLIAIRQIMTNLISLIGIVILVNSEKNILIAASITVLSGLINSLWLLGVFKKMYGKISFEIDKTYLKEILKESIPLALSSFMIAIYYNLDMVMMGYMKPERDLGIYSAAYKIILVGIVPFSLILNSFFPSLSKIGLKNSFEFRNIIKHYAIFMFSTGILIGSILFFNAQTIIKVIFGTRFESASIPLSILALNLLVIGANMFFGNPLIAWGKQKQYSITIALGAITNIILNVLLIPKYSYIGASFATLMSEGVVFVGVFVLFISYTKKYLMYES
jgi:O-antigen/teichoic acid export membrane protein